MRAIRKTSDFNNYYKGDVINFVGIKEKTKNIFNQYMWILDLGDGLETSIILDEWTIEE